MERRAEGGGGESVEAAKVACPTCGREGPLQCKITLGRSTVGGGLFFQSFPCTIFEIMIDKSGHLTHSISWLQNRLLLIFCKFSCPFFNIHDLSIIAA